MLKFINNAISKEDVITCRPIVAFIRLSGKCNAKCPHCFVKKRQNINDMPVEDVKEIVVKLKDLKTKEIVFTGGEPLMYNEISSLMEYVNDLGIKPSVITNGYYLEKYVEKIVNSKAKRIIISWDSPEEIQHDSIRGLNGLSNRIKSGIRKARECIEMQNADTEMHCNIVIHRFNMHKLEEFFKLVEFKMLNQINLIPIKGAIHMHPTYDDMVLFNSNKQHLLNLFNNANIKISNIDIFGTSEATLKASVQRRYTREIYKTTECFVSKLMIFIDNNGDIYPCNTCDFKVEGPFFVDNYYGKGRDLAGIWFSQKLTEVRERIQLHKKTICTNCDPLLVAENKCLSPLSKQLTNT